jgi:hypothetical protein
MRLSRDGSSGEDPSLRISEFLSNTLSPLFKFRSPIVVF